MKHPVAKANPECKQIHIVSFYKLGYFERHLVIFQCAGEIFFIVALVAYAYIILCSRCTGKARSQPNQ
jgi:hypothetical protein